MGHGKGMVLCYRADANVSINKQPVKVRKKGGRVQP